jgi:monofunctional glycosyltransferase
VILLQQPSKRSSRVGWRRIVGLVAITVIAVLLVPYLLTPLYLIVRPVSTPMLWRYATFQPVKRTWMPLDEIAPALPRTVIASEDSRFCIHNGVDWRTLRELLQEVEDFDGVRGGSTISQQTAKNLFLWSGRSYVRKALELPLAMWLELILGKRRVMEIYLNIAEWGPTGEYGAEAGSRRAFGKSASALTGREAALLAAMLPNPRVRDALKPGPAVRRLSAIYVARAGSKGLDAGCLRLSRADRP